MKRKLLSVLGLLCLSTIGYFVFKNNTISNNENLTDVSVTDQHKLHMKNSPFSEISKLTKEERKSQGLPPNKYLEREWELTMNPETGRPEPGNLKAIKEQMNRMRLEGRVSGDAADNAWVERGPDNVGGRTRALMFDPNDASNETVFAGGVSGGLWKNTNISNSNSVWTQVPMSENLNVSSITVDPNNSNIFYIGTGESYVGGDVNGNGVWKSFLDGIGNAAGYGFILIVVAFFRELLGSGKLLGYQVIPDIIYEMGYVNNGLMLLSPMALITVGLYIWFQRSKNRSLIEKN